MRCKVSCTRALDEMPRDARALDEMQGLLYMGWRRMPKGSKRDKV